MTLKIEYTPLLQKTKDCKARTVVNVGGAGSSKSWSIAQLIILKFINEENKQFVITRKTMPACKRSSYGLIIDLLQEYGYYGRANHNKTDHTISLGSNNMLFLGLDEPTKVKSLKEGANYIWMEEADEFTYDDYMAFKLQLRKRTTRERNQMYLSFNPIDGNGWIPTKLIPQDDVEVIHSTIDDNPFADEDYKKELDKRVEGDENYYKVYRLGEWGKLENIIYSNWEQVDEMPKEYDAMAYGLDFGYEKPMALIKVATLNQEVYLDERLYETHKLNSWLIERLSHEDRADLYAPPEEPDKIQEICNAGYVAYPANNKVQMGFDVCKRQRLHITKSSINLIKELRGYQRKKDKDGHVLEEPVKANDHACDAFRYGLVGITERYGFATARPGAKKSKHSMRI